MVTKDEIDDAFVDQVEDELGMGCGAWDMIDPKAIIAAAVNVYLSAKGV